MFKDKKAHHALIRARTVLLVKEPFYGCLALHLNLVEWPDEKQWPGGSGTMAVDGKNMYYFPPFVLSLTEEELVGVVAHEVSHCSYQHMSRRGSRHHVVWNWAGDFVINADLLMAGFTLPKQRLHDPKYDKLSTEEVYDRLMHEVKQKQKQQSKNGGSGGKKG